MPRRGIKHTIVMVLTYLIPMSLQLLLRHWCTMLEVVTSYGAQLTHNQVIVIELLKSDTANLAVNHLRLCLQIPLC